MAIFEKDQDTIGWDDKTIGQRLPMYQPQIIGATDRLMILSDPKKRSTHYVQGLGYIHCNGGKCCELLDAPSLRLGVVAFKYETDRDGEVPKDANGQFIVKGELCVIMLTENMYANFAAANKKAQTASEGKESLKTVDVLVGVQTEHKKQWKQWDVTLARRSIFYDTVAKAKSEKKPDGDPKIAEWFQALVPRMKGLWEKLTRELGRDVTDQQLLEALGKGAPAASAEAVPDVGDATALLDQL